MKLRDKEMAVFDVLRQQTKAIQMPELLRLLGSEYSERSLRRWLKSLCDEGLIEISGKKRGTYYRAIEQQATVKLTSDHNQETLAYIKQPIFKRKPVSYNQTWLTEYQPNRTHYFSPQQLQLLQQTGKRSSNNAPAGTYARRIYNRLLIDLSFNSSRLEGNTYSLRDTERLILEGSHAEGKLNEETVMILNHKEAIRYLIDNSNKLKIESNEIYTLHYLLADGLVPTRYAGKVRDHGVRISGSPYIPLEDPTRLQQQLEIICNKASLIQQAHEQSLFLLVHIAYLQAFSDVNKRTSRLSANIPLLYNNLVPLSFNDLNKEDYSTAMLAIYELNDVTLLVELYLNSYIRTSQLYDVTAEAYGIDEIRVRYRQLRREIIRHIIINQLQDQFMQDYIESQMQKRVTHSDQVTVAKDIKLDLKELSPQRITGLGITQKQLEDWLGKQDLH